MERITGEQLIKIAGDRQELLLKVKPNWIPNETCIVKLVKGKNDMFLQGDRRTRYGNAGKSWFLFSKLRDGGWNSYIKPEYFSREFPTAWCLGKGLSEGLANMTIVAEEVTLYDLL